MILTSRFERMFGRGKLPDFLSQPFGSTQNLIKYVYRFPCWNWRLDGRVKIESAEGKSLEFFRVLPNSVTDAAGILETTTDAVAALRSDPFLSHLLQSLCTKIISVMQGRNRIFSARLEDFVFRSDVPI